MSFQTNLDRWLKKAEKAGSTVSMAMIFMLMVLVAGDILLRKFGTWIPGNVSLVAALLIILVFTGLSYTQSVRGHVTIDALLDILPSRARNILGVITSALTFVAIAALFWGGIRETQHAWVDNAVTLGEVPYPQWIFYIFIPIGSFFFCLRAIVQLLEHIKLFKEQPAKTQALGEN